MLPKNDFDYNLLDIIENLPERMSVDGLLRVLDVLDIGVQMLIINTSQCIMYII